MKNKTLSTLFLLLFIIHFSLSIFHSSSGFSQNWTTPVNISNMDGMDRQPDIFVDNNNIIHCVWVHDIESNFTKIYYTKSSDDGIIWTIPEDISQNDEKWVGSPKIIIDTNNKLIVSYDYNVGSPSNTIIFFRYYNDGAWSEVDTITPNMPGSRFGKPVIDNNNRLYCFWHHDINYGSTFYKYYENGQWSETIDVLPGNEFLAITKVVCDLNNNLHCIGGYHAIGETHDDDKIVYLNMVGNDWLPFDVISTPTSPGQNIDVDLNNSPHITFRQRSPGTPNDEDSTIYRNRVNSTWSEPELVVEDPRKQKIAIDENNKPNIFDVEKTEEGTMLVHHFKDNGFWQGYIIDESPWNTIHYAIYNHNHKLYAIYNKPEENNVSEINFSKTDIITQIENLPIKNNLTLKPYPNPFKQYVRISFELNKTERTLIRIYSMEGKLINTIIDEIKPSGKYETIWNANDMNGKEVKPGHYLVRLQCGRNILSRMVEYINE